MNPFPGTIRVQGKHDLFISSAPWPFIWTLTQEREIGRFLPHCFLSEVGGCSWQRSVEAIFFAPHRAEWKHHHHSRSPGCFPDPRVVVKLSLPYTNEPVPEFLQPILLHPRGADMLQSTLQPTLFCESNEKREGSSPAARVQVSARC